MGHLTTNPNDPDLGHGVDKDRVGQNKKYLVLPQEELDKGFIRPVRHSYIHVGPHGPKHPLRELTLEEHERYDNYGYVAFEVYPKSESPKVGKFWTQEQLDKLGKGCKTVTTMGQALAETYARNPTFYGATYCCHCCKHLPVEEFEWIDDGTIVGS